MTEQLNWTELNYLWKYSYLVQHLDTTSLGPFVFLLWVSYLSLTVESTASVEAWTLWILGRWKFKNIPNALLSQLLTDDLFQVQSELSLSEVVAQQKWVRLKLCRDQTSVFWCYQIELWVHSLTVEESQSSALESWRKLSTEELMLLNCGVGEDSWGSFGLPGDPTSSSQRKPILNIPWKDWCWSWNSNTLATWFEELTHLKRPWCWRRLKARGERDDRGWDGWMASLTQWKWVWVNSRSCWWTGKPGVLQSMGSQRVRHDWETELNWICL